MLARMLVSRRVVASLLWAGLSLYPWSDARAWRLWIDGGDPLRHSHRAYAIAKDASGDLIAAGHLRLAGAQYDFTAVKIDASGTEVWRTTVDGTAHLDDTAKAVAVDPSGNAVVAGWLESSTTGRDPVAMKLSGTDGSELWRTELDDTDGSLEFVALDGAGNVLALGELGSDAFVVKLSGATGAELWRAEVSDGAGTDLAVDAANDVVVTAGDAVVKLDGVTGGEAWRVTDLDGPQSVTIRGVAIDASGDVVATGSILETTDHRTVVVVKLSGTDGDEIWRRVLDGTRGNGVQVGFDVVVTAAGDVVASSTLFDAARTGDYGVVVKLAGASGADVWRWEYRPSGEFVSPAELAVGPSGDVFALGTSSHSTYAARLDGGTGQPVWSQSKIALFDPSAITLLGSHLVVAGGRLILPGDFDFAVVRFHETDGSIGPEAGQRLVVRDVSIRLVTFVGKSSTLVTAPPGSAADPRVGGALVTIRNPVTAETASFSLPAGSAWTGLGNPAGSKGYRYLDPSFANGPCRRFVSQPGKMQLACGGGNAAPIPFTLDEPTQGSLAVTVRLGTGGTQCVPFGGTIVKDQGKGNPSPVGLFSAKNAPVVDGSCAPFE